LGTDLCVAYAGELIEELSVWQSVTQAVIVGLEALVAGAGVFPFGAPSMSQSGLVVSSRLQPGALDPAGHVFAAVPWTVFSQVFNA